MNDLVERLRRGTLVWIHDDGTETWEAPHIAMTEAADEIEMLEKANAQLRHIVETEQDITEEEALLREIDRELDDVEYLGSYVEGIKALKAQLAACEKGRDEWKEASLINERLRIELREQLAAVTKERDDRLSDAKWYFKLATESSAREAKLREALNQMCLSAELPKEFDSYPSQLSYSLVLAREALAQPHDDTALRQYVAGVLREMADWFEQRAMGPETKTYDAEWVVLRRKADELENGK